MVTKIIGDLKNQSESVGDGIQALKLYNGYAYWKNTFIGRALVVGDNNVVTYVDDFDTETFKKHCDIHGKIISKHNISNLEFEVWRKLVSLQGYEVRSSKPIKMTEENFDDEFFSEYETYMVKL